MGLGGFWRTILPALGREEVVAFNRLEGFELKGSASWLYDDALFNVYKGLWAS